MSTKKNICIEQIADVNTVAALLAEIPKGQKSLVAMAATAFIAGMEAQRMVAAPPAISQAAQPSA